MTVSRGSRPEGEAITLVVPMPPNIANGKHGHWAERHRSKGDYWQTLDTVQALGRHRLDEHGPMFRADPPPQQPFAKARIRSVMYLGNAMDDSNAMRRHKWIEDWLKTRGYIVDDRRSCLTWEGLPEQVVKRDGNYRIEIVLTPVVA